MSESNAEETPYSDTSPFVRLLGTPGRAKIIDTFLRKHYQDLSASEVARLADIAPSTFHRNIDDLIDSGIIKESRQVGNTQLYELNTDHPVAKILGRTRSELLEHIESAPEPPAQPPTESGINPRNDGLGLPQQENEREFMEEMREETKDKLEV